MPSRSEHGPPTRRRDAGLETDELNDGLNRYADATLGSGNLRQAVKLPEGEDLSEWLAVNSESQ